MRDLLKGYRIFNIDARKSRSRDFYKNVLDLRRRTMRSCARTIKNPNKFSCPLCRSVKGSSFLRYNRYLLLECARCGLVSPNINFKALTTKKIYDDAAYVSSVTRQVLASYSYRKKTYAVERLNYLLDKTRLRPEKINLLDIGCGPGYFLSHLRDRAIQYKGLELADFLVAICKKKGLHVECSDLRNEPDRHYNAITIFDVLEHVTAPQEFFREMNQKLVRGGFVLAYIPNIHSLSFLLMGNRQNNLYPFHHLCFFDEKSLEYLAGRSGFKIDSIEYFGLDVVDYFCMKSWEDGVDYLSSLKIFMPLMQAMIDKNQLGNHMRVVFRKTGEAPNLRPPKDRRPV